MWQQADSSVVRADVQRLSDSRSSFTVLDGGRGEVIEEHYSLSVVSFMNSGVLGRACRWTEQLKHLTKFKLNRFLN